MRISLTLKYPCIMFRDVDENCLNYFQCKNTADCVVFGQKDINNWALHIFEMKKTVKTKEWEKIQRQFKGAYYNALAIAGFLGIIEYIKETKFYICYKNDGISSDTIGMRASLAKANPLEKEWNTGRFKMKCFETIHCHMEKIKVTEDFTAQYLMDA